MKFVLKEPDLLFKKFDHVFVVSPSVSEFSDLFLPKENLCSELDFEWIETKLEKLANSEKYLNVLLILDDVVVDLKSESNNKRLLALVFNRRHKLNNVILYITILSTGNGFNVYYITKI